MTAFGYIFIAAAILVIRQVIVGRVSEMGGDLRDFTVGLLSGDMDAVNEVAKRRGENVPVADLEATGTSPPKRGGKLSLSIFADYVVELGDAADKYQWGATGPNAYDCSGLIWRAMHDLKIYQGPRFTTSTFSRSVGSKIGQEVSTPQTGDIVIWDGKHMGVYIGGGDYYSARSPSKGIGVSRLAGDSAYFGRKPRIWRIG